MTRQDRCRGSRASGRGFQKKDEFFFCEDIANVNIISYICIKKKGISYEKEENYEMAIQNNR